MDSALKPVRTRLALSTYFIFLLGCWTIINSCKQNNTCTQPQTLALRGGFYIADTANTFRDTVLVNANLFFGSSSQYMQSIKKARKFSFPLAQNEDSITVFFQSDSLTNSPNTIDTFSIYYTKELHFISVACGYQNYFTITHTACTKHVLDTMITTTALVNNDVNKEHIKIVLKK